jgi:hypothetical protein
MDAEQGIIFMYPRDLRKQLPPYVKNAAIMRHRLALSDRPQYRTPEGQKRVSPMEHEPFEQGSSTSSVCASTVQSQK